MEVAGVKVEVEVAGVEVQEVEVEVEVEVSGTRCGSYSGWKLTPE